MCTVSFLPTSESSIRAQIPVGSGFILTVNRDEWVGRQRALLPRRYRLGDQLVFFPKDTQGEGTWIATDEQQYTLCLLKGAFESHAPNPPYRQSLEQVIMDFFSYDSETDFSVHYEFAGLEPFTLIIVRYEPDLALIDLRWDGTKLHRTVLDVTAPYLWSSVTLFTKAIRQKRERWFDEWRASGADFSQESIVQFHRRAGEGDSQNDLIMQRPNGIRTVSITSVERNERAHRIYYQDMQTKTATTFRILS